MNSITIIIIISAFIIAATYMITKMICLNSLTNALNNKNYQAVLKNAEKPLTRTLLQNYNCDLFMMRSYYLMHDIDNLRKKAIEMLNNDYKDHQMKDFLQLYYHIFLNLNDLEMANIFLDKIVKVNDQPFVKYNQYTYNVLIEKEDDLIETMGDEIASKVYDGFALGTIVYLIAMQYLYKQDYANAKLYFQECLTCFHPKAFYVELANKHLAELNDM